MTRSTLLAALAFAGCSQQPPAAPSPEPGAVVVAPVVVDAPAPKPETQPVAAQPAPPVAEPPTFKFAPDLTGRAVSKAVAPGAPLKPQTERFGAEPKPRAVPAKYLDPDPTARAVHALPPVLPARPAPVKPVAPAERVPLTLGAGADALPVALVLPVAPVVTERARDVNVPPPAPVLARQNTERVPFDDPTSEVGNAVVVANAVPVPLGVSGFLKITVPDPFELAEQVKPSVPPAAEPSPKPVEVNPQRVK